MVLFQKLFLLLVLIVLLCSFLPAQTVYKPVVGDILIVGNKVTHEGIVLRELEFQTGDTLSADRISGLMAQSVQNLLKLPLFHFVTIDSVGGSSPGAINFTINLTERWYTWVWPVFELYDRNFNSWFERGDITRLSYGLFFQQENFRGRLEKLHIKFRLGYQHEATLLYEKPYLNRRKTIGAGMLLSVSRQRETGFKTENDKLLYYRADDFLQRTADIAVFVRWRPDIHFSHTLQFRVNRVNAADSLLLLNPYYTVAGQATQQFTELSYLLKTDFRDQRAYPLNGFYAEGLLAKKGIMNSDDLDYTSAKVVLRGYRRLNQRFFLAGSFTGQVVSNINLPYNISQALGYRRDYVRGYEYYVIDGRNFWLTKVNLKYALIRPAVKKLKWPPSERFNTIPYAVYLGAFADAGKVWPSSDSGMNRLPGSLLKGIGMGLDFVTYYDKVFRAEFSMNGKGEPGFFLHFMAAI
jgi:outer membrane protein assembly factor BamA